MMQTPKDPKAPWRVVLVQDGVRDPAIAPDVEAGVLIEYATTRDPDAIGSAVRLVGGTAPTWFTLAPLSLRFMNDVAAREPHPERQRVLACRAALVTGEGPMAESLRFDEREAGIAGMQLIVESEMERIAGAIGVAGIHELGDIALVRARLRAGAPGPFGLCR